MLGSKTQGGISGNGNCRQFPEISGAEFSFPGNMPPEFTGKMITEFPLLPLAKLGISGISSFPGAKCGISPLFYREITGFPVKSGGTRRADRFGMIGTLRSEL